MWGMGSGGRSANPVERFVYAELVSQLLDNLESGFPLELEDLGVKGGASHWNCLEVGEQIGALCLSARAIFDPKTPAPEYCALFECAAYAPFLYLAALISAELDVQDHFSLEDAGLSARTTAMALLYGSHPKETVDLLPGDEECAGYQFPLGMNGEMEIEEICLPAWFRLIDFLADSFFEDRDWTLFPYAEREGLSGYVGYSTTHVHRRNLPKDPDRLMSELARDWLTPILKELPQEFRDNLLSHDRTDLLQECESWVAPPKFEEPLDPALWKPLHLNRPAPQEKWVSESDYVYYSRPCNLTPVEDYPFFECRIELTEVPLSQLRSFIEVNRIGGSFETEADCIAAILKWQELVLISLGFIKRQPYEAINFYDWGKAIPRRRTYEQDRCALIENTGFMEIEDTKAHFTMFISTENGYQHVVKVQIENGGWSGYYGWLITDMWKISGRAGSAWSLWTEVPKHLTQQQFLEAAINPPDRFFEDERHFWSMAAYEVRKHQRILSHAFEVFSENLFTDRVYFDSKGRQDYWEVDLAYWDAKNPLVIEVPEFEQTEKMTLTFRATISSNERQHFQISVALAPLLLTAFFNGMRKMAIEVDLSRKTPYLQDDSEDRSDSLYYASSRKSTLSLYDSWLTQLESISIYRDEVLQVFKAQSSDRLSAVLIPELQELKTKLQ